MEKKEEYFQVLNKLTKSFSGDEYYQIFQELLSRGKNSIQIYRRKNNKIIDKEWVNFIEGCIISLDNIIRNPRKFIAREEEIVPIELSRSITTESVKHLAQHTNLISEVTEDSITPNKILNINKEESFDVYENRFVYTLLLKLKDFVDKRVDLIVNAMVDNDIINVDVKSNFLFEDRVVDYELKLNTKANTDDVDTTNNEDVQILQRVTKMSKIINDFCSSPFANVMKKSALVKPPITRTNVILKNPDFKKALTLWQFVETYDKVGFDVQTEESIEDISKESYQEMSDNIFMNMILFKNVLELNKPENKVEKKSHYSPKFMKKFMDLMVNSIDFDDVEFKKVFLETYNNRQIELDSDQVDKINKVIDDALLADESYLLQLELERQRIEREKQEALERKKAEEEAKREAIRLAKEEEKRKKDEAKAEARRKLEEEKEKKRQERLERKRAKEAILREKQKAAEEKEIFRIMEIKKDIEGKTISKQSTLEEEAKHRIKNMMEQFFKEAMTKSVKDSSSARKSLMRMAEAVRNAKANPDDVIKGNEGLSLEEKRKKIKEDKDLSILAAESKNLAIEKQQALEKEAEGQIKSILSDYFSEEMKKVIDASPLAKQALKHKAEELKQESENNNINQEQKELLESVNVDELIEDNSNNEVVEDSNTPKEENNNNDN